MPIDFKPDENTAFDAGTGVTISHPRILPSARLDGTDEIEYQYMFRRGQHRIGAVGFFGTEEVVHGGGHPERIYTLDLSPDRVMESILAFKQALGNVDDEFTFISCLAQGLVHVFAGQTDNSDVLHYVVIVYADTLARLRLPVAGVLPVLPDGKVVLASLSVPAHVG